MEFSIPTGKYTVRMRQIQNSGFSEPEATSKTVSLEPITAAKAKISHTEGFILDESSLLVSLDQRTVDHFPQRPAASVKLVAAIGYACACELVGLQTFSAGNIMRKIFACMPA